MYFSLYNLKILFLLSVTGVVEFILCLKEIIFNWHQEKNLNINNF